MKLRDIFLFSAVFAVLGAVLPAPVTAEVTIQKKTINEDGIVADFFFCKDAENQRPLILLGGAEGGKALSEQTEKISALVQRGYAVLVLAYFGMDGLPPTLQSIPLEYFDKAVDWVSKQPLVDPNGVGIIAGSKGTEAALLLATTNHNIKAVVAIAPSAYVFWGIHGPGGKNERVSSWSRDGKDVSFAPMVSSKETVIEAMQTHRFLTIYSEAIAGPEAAKGEIRIEQAKAPILFISGKNDQLWPSYKMAESMMQKLKQNNYAYHYEHLSFNTGHGVIHEAPESWDKIFDFLETCYSRSSRPDEKSQNASYQKKENKIQ
jgi:dienelactone hydrolase